MPALWSKKSLCLIFLARGGAVVSQPPENKNVAQNVLQRERNPHFRNGFVETATDELSSAVPIISTGRGAAADEEQQQLFLPEDHFPEQSPPVRANFRSGAVEVFMGAMGTTSPVSAGQAFVVEQQASRHFRGEHTTDLLHDTEQGGTLVGRAPAGGGESGGAASKYHTGDEKQEYVVDGSSSTERLRRNFRGEESFFERGVGESFFERDDRLAGESAIEEERESHFRGLSSPQRQLKELKEKSSEVDRLLSTRPTAGPPAEEMIEFQRGSSSTPTPLPVQSPPLLLPGGGVDDGQKSSSTGERGPGRGAPSLSSTKTGDNDVVSPVLVEDTRPPLEGVGEASKTSSQKLLAALRNRARAVVDRAFSQSPQAATAQKHEENNKSSTTRIKFSLFSTTIAALLNGLVPSFRLRLDA